MRRRLSSDGMWTIATPIGGEVVLYYLATTRPFRRLNGLVVAR